MLVVVYLNIVAYHILDSLLESHEEVYREDGLISCKAEQHAIALRLSLLEGGGGGGFQCSIR